ncbi:hypothetical protein C5167_031810 [Papaver somniferum]|uniref:Pentacotripeptide-repeat region of PRORP domain-containing protein n=1 Tax=Papaver somniferum TaxID=3469 RepID=A0A4Y7K6K6_PAPSO|nr:hypothetical protein C5167_031810 [Papaver somniferum]
MEGTGILANVEMYSILINGLSRAGKLEDARKLLDEMPEKGLVPNVVTCTTMIAGLFHHRMSLEANKLIIQMEEKGCLLDSRTYDTIIKGFLQGKETEKALQFLRKMHERKFVPSDPVVSLLIKTLSTDELKNLDVPDAKTGWKFLSDGLFLYNYGHQLCNMTSCSLFTWASGELFHLLDFTWNSTGAARFLNRG